MLHLEKLNHKNIWDIVDLKVFKLQKDFVAPNWASIIEAYSILDTETAAFPFGIYNDKKDSTKVMRIAISRKVMNRRRSMTIIIPSGVA